MPLTKPPQRARARRPAMTGKVVAILGTLDTKGVEFAWLKARVEAAGAATLVIDVGILGAPAFPPDVTADEVARAAGADLAALRARGDRGEAVAAMAKGAAEVVARLHREGRIDGIVSMGGGGGTAIATAAMRALPVGVPKLMVSTLAAGDVRAYVGVSDVTMMPAVVDVAGINRISARIIANAAAAIAGMVEAEPPALAGDRPLIAATMFGVTTPCVTRARAVLEAAGYEVLVFHATGTGGESMEALIRGGFIAGVLDITTTELADELVGGVLSAGPHRLEAAGETGIPQVVSVGALDMVNFGRAGDDPREVRRPHLLPAQSAGDADADHGGGERRTGADHRREARPGEGADGADAAAPGRVADRRRGQAVPRPGRRPGAVRRAQGQPPRQCRAGRDGHRHQRRRLRGAGGGAAAREAPVMAIVRQYDILRA